MFDFCLGGSECCFFGVDFFVAGVVAVGPVDPHDHALAGGGCVFDDFEFEVGYVFGVVEVLAEVGDDRLVGVLYLVLEQFVE